MRTAYLKKVTDLNMKMLSKLGVQYILLDIDNTIKKIRRYKARRGCKGMGGANAGTGRAYFAFFQ